MAVIKAISSRATPSKIYGYLTKDEKTEEKLISGFNCSPNNMVNEFNATKELYNKNNGVQYQHIIQSFDPKDNITHEKAHELGRELVENKFKGFEVLIVTHKDKEHIHNHFVINSVSYESGLKYRATNKSLWEIKRESNRICERELLTTLDLNHKAKERLTSGELRKELRGEITWKGELKKCINFAKEKTNSLQEFAEYLKQNFNIDTRITNKMISYKHPERKQGIRGSKLGTDYDKEELLNGFTRKEKSINRERNREYGVKPREETNSTEFRSSNRRIEQDIEQTNEPIRSGAHEGREYGTKKTTSDLYNQLREIRSIGNEYSPDARA
ncbi:relaxase/mobilization nuclease domain-containing protein, partial [Clostridium beijerinckii]